MGAWPIIIFAKFSILDIWQGSEYAIIQVNKIETTSHCVTRPQKHLSESEYEKLCVILNECISPYGIYT